MVSCGGTTVPDAATFLAQAKAKVDAAAGLHFVLTSDNARGGRVALTGAEGHARRPNAFTGVLHVAVGGAPLQVSVVSINGTFYAQPPFSSHFGPEQPSNYGFGDPGRLLDPSRGLSSLYTLARSPTLGDRTRYQGEELQEVRCTLPGDRVGALLTSADPSRNVQATFRIDPATQETRQVDLTGPFLVKDHDTTYHLLLDMYGENVTVTAPPS